MEFLNAILYALCFATATATNLGPLETEVEIGSISYHASGDSPLEKQAANNIIGLLEYLRNLMTVGIDLTVPIMEPYKLDVLPTVELDGQTGPLDGKVDLRNLVASGAQRFTVNDIEVAINDKRVDFNISVPKLEIDVDYEGKNLVYDHIFEFSTSGHVHITLLALDIVGSFCAQQLLGIPNPPYYIVGIRVHNKAYSVEVDKGGPIPDVIVDQVKDALMTSVAQAAKDELSTILHHFTEEQVKKFLEG